MCQDNIELLKQIIKDNKRSYWKIIKCYYNDLYNHIMTFTGKTFAEKLYRYLNPNVVPQCNHCGSPNVRFKEITTGFSDFCSQTCTQKSDRITKIREDACMKKYGVKNAAMSDETKNKIKQTNLEKYGVENVYQSEIIKDKIKLTNINNLGYENPGQSPLIKEKIKTTNNERFGGNAPACNSEILQKMAVTTLEKYGVEYYTQTDDYKEKSKSTCLEKYGVEHHNQSPEILEKMLKKRFKYKNFTLPSGVVVKLQGYENFGLNDLLKDYSEDDIIFNKNKVPGLWYYDNNKRRKYHPDFFIISKNKIIEIKSEYTYYADYNENILKKNAAIEQGYDFEFMIYNNKGERVYLR